MSSPEDLEEALNDALKRMVQDMVGQFHPDDFVAPKVCALACAMAMELFLSMADLGEEERDYFFSTVLPEMRDGWEVSIVPPENPEEGSIIVKIQGDDETDEYYRSTNVASKLIH